MPEPRPTTRGESGSVPGTPSSRGASSPDSTDRPPQPPLDQTRCGGGGRLNLLLSWGSWRPDSWVDRLPFILEPMGVTSHRVSTAREAERFIRANKVHIAVVDLGLPLDECRPGGPMPEEGGPRVLELLRRLESPPPTVVVKAPPSRREETRHLCAALKFDAFAVVDRTAADVEQMLRVLHRCMERFYQNRWPRNGE